MIFICYHTTLYEKQIQKYNLNKSYGRNHLVRFYYSPTNAQVCGYAHMQKYFKWKGVMIIKSVLMSVLQEKKRDVTEKEMGFKGQLSLSVAYQFY